MLEASFQKSLDDSLKLVFCKSRLFTLLNYKLEEGGGLVPLTLLSAAGSDCNGTHSP